VGISIHVHDHTHLGQLISLPRDLCHVAPDTIMFLHTCFIFSIISSSKVTVL
jgi:hypothetical protein